MERYTRLLLHFIYGVKAALDQPVDAFLFSTRLTRVTRPLHNLPSLEDLTDRLADLNHPTARGYHARYPVRP